MPPRTALSLTARTELKTRLGIRFSSILQMSEEEVSRLVRLLESDPIFQKLYRTDDPDYKVFSRQRLPSSRISSSFYEIDESRTPTAPEFSGMQAAFLKHKTLLEKIRVIGQENFENYFLYNEEEKAVSVIAKELGISEAMVRETRELTDQVMMESNFFQPAGVQEVNVSPELSVTFTRIAGYSLKSDGSIEIILFSPGMASGLYKINYDKLTSLKKKNALNAQEKKEIQEIIRWLELLNGRKNLIFRIVKMFPERQGRFLKTEDWGELVPLAQKMIAEEFKVTPSAVCRAIHNRSILLPSGQEVVISDLFPSRKEILKRQVAPIFEKNKDLADREIQVLVQRQCGVSLSRRSINVYRNEIRSSKRKKSVHKTEGEVKNV